MKYGVSFQMPEIGLVYTTKQINDEIRTEPVVAKNQFLHKSQAE